MIYLEEKIYFNLILFYKDNIGSFFPLKTGTLVSVYEQQLQQHVLEEF